MSQTVGDFLVERLHAWGVRKIFGYPGDGITAVRMVMNVNDNDRSGTDRAQISRVLEHTITFRNRAP